VGYCLYHGAPNNVEYLDLNNDSTIAAAHQYYEIRFTLLAADIPVDPDAPPPDPLAPPPPPPRDRVYQIASVTLRANPPRAVDGMEQQGLIVHPTPFEQDLQAAPHKATAAEKKHEIEAQKAETREKKLLEEPKEHARGSK
jgi:hypothetical protein